MTAKAPGGRSGDIPDALDVVFTGAGISTESGVPDFRSPGGVWSKMKPIYFQEFVGDEDTMTSLRDLGVDFAQGYYIGHPHPVSDLRTEQPASKISLALECGGSDGNSGVTANPALGAAADLLVRHGGTAVLSETPKWADPSVVPADRPIDVELFERDGLEGLSRPWGAACRQGRPRARSGRCRPRRRCRALRRADDRRHVQSIRRSSSSGSDTPRRRISSMRSSTMRLVSGSRDSKASVNFSQSPPSARYFARAWAKAFGSSIAAAKSIPARRSCSPPPPLRTAARRSRRSTI